MNRSSWQLYQNYCIKKSITCSYVNKFVCHRFLFHHIIMMCCQTHAIWGWQNLGTKIKYNSVNLACMGPDSCWIIRYSCSSDGTYTDPSSLRFAACHQKMYPYQLLSFHHKNTQIFQLSYAQSQIFLWNAFLQTTYTMPCPTVLTLALSMSAIWKCYSHFHLMS